MRTHPQPLHVVVLAAGVGSRLTGTASCPKWLTRVGGSTVADQQLRGLDLVDADVTLHLVTGHLAGRVEERVAGRPGTTCVPNPEHAALNNWWSVLTALRFRRAQAVEGTFVIINSDLWARADWFASAVGDVARSQTATLVVDTRRRLTDEAMKVAALPRGADLFATAIGKVGVNDPVGEYTGVLSVPAGELEVFEKALESFVDDPTRENAWYEHAVDLTLRQGMAWQLVEAPTTTWVEIDDDGDRATAERLARGAA